MRLERIAIGAICLCLIATARAHADVAKGRALAERLCAVCHMNPGQGEKQGPQGVPGFAAIAKRPNMTEAGIVAWLKSAPPMMPNHHLTNAEAEALAAFIASLGQGK